MAWGAGIAPDPAVVVQLIKVFPGSRDSNGLWIVIQALPVGARIAMAWGARIAPDPAVVMQLIKILPSSRDSNGLWIVIQALPVGARIAMAGVPV